MLQQTIPRWAVAHSIYPKIYNTLSYTWTQLQVSGIHGFRLDPQRNVLPWKRKFPQDPEQKTILPSKFIPNSKRFRALFRALEKLSPKTQRCFLCGVCDMLLLFHSCRLSPRKGAVDVLAAVRAGSLSPILLFAAPRLKRSITVYMNSCCCCCLVLLLLLLLLLLFAAISRGLLCAGSYAYSTFLRLLPFLHLLAASFLCFLISPASTQKPFYFLFHAFFFERWFFFHAHASLTWEPWWPENLKTSGF